MGKFAKLATAPTAPARLREPPRPLELHEPESKPSAIGIIGGALREPDELAYDPLQAELKEGAVVQFEQLLRYMDPIGRVEPIR